MIRLLPPARAMGKVWPSVPFACKGLNQRNTRAGGASTTPQARHLP